MQAAIYQEWIVNLGRRDAIARIAHILCELIVRLQAVGLARDLSFSMPWTQMDVADASGISNVHANRVIQELRQLGLVEWDSKHVRIKNWYALVQLGEFNEHYLKYGGGNEGQAVTLEQGTCNGPEKAGTASELNKMPPAAFECIKSVPSR
jgi:hypothetical protein